MSFVNKHQILFHQLLFACCSMHALHQWLTAGQMDCVICLLTDGLFVSLEHYNKWEHHWKLEQFRHSGSDP